VRPVSSAQTTREKIEHVSSDDLGLDNVSEDAP
jgi:hypothetical protein